jgi:recombination protein RecR
MKVPEPIRRFVEIFSELPGIGPRQAIRLAFYFIHRGRALQSEAASVLASLKGIKICKQCFFIYQGAGDLCDICADPRRDKSVIAVVEKETDLLSLENAKNFTGNFQLPIYNFQSMSQFSNFKHDNRLVIENCIIVNLMKI